MEVSYTVWQDLGAALATNNDPFYLEPEQWLGANPMEPLTVVPGTTTFFGSKVLNLFVVAIPYAWEQVDGVWTDLWPPPGYLDLVALHKEVYAEFASYKTYVWMDFNIVNTVMALNPSSRFEDMMLAVETHMQEMCTELAEYGFTFVGRDPTQSDFQTLIDELRSA